MGVFHDPHIFQDAIEAAVAGTAMEIEGLSGVGVQIEGITSATITFQASIDGSTWYSVQALNLTSHAVAPTTTADGLYVVFAPAMTQLRCNITTYATGTITITGSGVTNPAIFSLMSLGTLTVSDLPSSVQGPGNPTIDSFSSAAVNLAASTANQVLVSSAPNKQIWVYGLFMQADTAAGTVALQDEDDTPLSGVMAVSDERGWVLPISGNFAMPWIKLATDKDLEADTGACTVDGIITYALVSV